MSSIIRTAEREQSFSEARTEADSAPVIPLEEIKVTRQPKKEEETFVGSFPPRPPLPKNDNRTITLTTNSYVMKLIDLNRVFVYSVKFSSNVVEDNTPLKRLIIRKLKDDVEKTFVNYLFAGTILYSPKDIGTAPVNLKIKEFGNEYTVEILKATFICIDDILGFHKDMAKVQTVQTFLNLIIKNLLNGCKMYPVGRTSKYLLPAESKKIHGQDFIQQ